MIEEYFKSVAVTTLKLCMIKRTKFGLGTKWALFSNPLTYSQSLICLTGLVMFDCLAIITPVTCVELQQSSSLATHMINLLNVSCFVIKVHIQKLLYF